MRFGYGRVYLSDHNSKKAPLAAAKGAFLMKNFADQRQLIV